MCITITLFQCYRLTHPCRKFLATPLVLVRVRAWVRRSAVREGVPDGRQDVCREAEDDDRAPHARPALPAAALLHHALQRQNTSGTTHSRARSLDFGFRGGGG